MLGDTVLPLYLDRLLKFPESPDVASAHLLLNNFTKELIERGFLRDAGNTGRCYSENARVKVCQSQQQPFYRVEANRQVRVSR